MAVRNDISTELAFVRANRRRLLGEDLARNATNFPRRVALHDVQSGWRMTFSEFDERVNAVAAALRARDLIEGDRLCMLGRNHLDTLTLYYAVCRLGVILVPLNYNANTEELRYIIEDAAPRAIAVSTEFVGRIDRGLLQGLDVFTYSPDAGTGDVAQWAKTPAPLLEGAIDDRACAFILYTGGTTGRPKGVMLSQAGYLAMADNTIESLAPVGFGRFDSWLVSGPLYHGAALAYSITGLHFAQTVHLLPQFEPEAALAAVARGFGSITWFIPTMSRRVLDTVVERGMDRTSIEGLRLIISAGAPLSLALRQELRRTFRCCQVIDMVGQTELTSTITAHSEPTEIEAHPTAVGYPAPGVTVALLDDENRPVADGEAGELCYRSESLMLGYWNKPDATREAMAGGWFHSGDLGRRDASGLIHIVGRKKELIKSGGENVIPNEIEHVLRAVPGVADACVPGLPDELWGERVHAVLAIGEGAVDAESIRAAAESACRGALSRYKVPKTWSVVAALPATPVGKVDKAALRALVADGKQPVDLPKPQKAKQKV